MRHEETRTDLGSVKIHKNVIASIAAIAATEIPGVKRIGTGLKSGIMELIGKRDLSAIKIDIDKNDDVRIDIPIVIVFGNHIPEVAGKVQESVRASLERMTTASIRDINITVQGIEKG